jgi:hypothetical protein
MLSSISLNDYISREKPKLKCDSCVIKQMVELGDSCYWPNDKGRWEYFLPEVDTTICDYLRKILDGQAISDDDIKEFDQCELFMPEMDWAGLRKDDIKIMQGLSDFIFLSTGIITDTETLVAVYQQVRKAKGPRIVSVADEGDDVKNQFSYERANYKLFALIRDAVLAVEKGDA